MMDNDGNSIKSASGWSERVATQAQRHKLDMESSRRD
jgi:hypothetical protein